MNIVLLLAGMQKNVSYKALQYVRIGMLPVQTRLARTQGPNL